ncbi:S-4TM family putative pore-forming effector [Hymenobacter terrenus]|uniref:S-4TM family putative pore-forming effector n=1 Tax=Hymenobacter terrenus TaxID=1629124 RepID=UPI0012E0C45B|nr:S-4TM family putative pore-forming effector [Hymenobacter terrenus]
MNTIPESQVERKQLERLAAQRELYSAAKVWYGWQLLITTAIPIILALIALIKEEFSTISAVFGAASLFVDAYLVDRNIKSRKERAVKIQELFDCDILQLPSSPLKVADDIKVEEVLRHYKAHAKIPTNIEKIVGWYSKEVGEVPIHIARIICQRTNCWWDATLRKRFAHFLKYSSVVALIIVLSVGCYREMDITSILLIIAGLTPFFQYCIKQHNDNVDAIKRLDELYYFAAQLWNRAVHDCGAEEILTLESRRLQDEIFNYRTNNPLILDWLYNKFRDEDEATMNASARLLVDEALASNCL